ncbi:MAG: hypothetical protein EOP48_33985 [Sphingobacteriales bacterium]|nr:MAG: hypothetical protein EOP48_33985 [Sphingobacteriales bacterium]
MNSKKIKFNSLKIHFANIKTLKGEEDIKDFDNILLPVHEEESALLLSHFYVKNKTAHFWGGDGWGPLARYIKRLPFADAINASWLSHYQASIKTASNNLFVQSYRKKYSSDPVDTSALYYEAMKLLMSGNNKSQKSSNILHSLTSYPGLTGEVLIKKSNVIRPMPLLYLDKGTVKVSEMLTPKE